MSNHRLVKKVVVFECTFMSRMAIPLSQHPKRVLSAAPSLLRDGPWECGRVYFLLYNEHVPQSPF